MAGDLLPDVEDLVVPGEDAAERVVDGLLTAIGGLELKELTSQKATGDNSYMQNTYEVVFTKFVET